MPAAAIVGAAAIGAVASNRAASRSASATNNAARRSVSEQRRQFDLVRGDTQPYRDVGRNALTQLAALFGLQGPSSPTNSGLGNIVAQQNLKSNDTTFRIPSRGFLDRAQTFPLEDIGISRPETPYVPQPTRSAEDLLKSTPGYQFRLSEQEKALERMQAARGYSLTPRAAKEVGRYASDYASGEFGNLVESLFRLSGLGGNAVNQSASAGANAAANIGNAYTNAGNAASQNAWNSAAGFNNAVQSGLNNYATWQAYNRSLPQQSQLYGGSGPAVNIGSDGWPT